MEDIKQPSHLRTSPDPQRRDDLLGGFLARQDFRVILEQAPALIAIVRGREGIVELCNIQFRKAWGNRPVVGVAMRKAWPELEPSGHFEHIEQVFDTGQPLHMRESPGFIDRHNNGHPDEAFFNFTYTPYKKASGQTIGVVIYGTEVTSQVMARRQAESNRTYLEYMLATAGIGTWEWEPGSNTCRWSQQTKRLFGLSPAENVTAGRYQSLIHPGDWPKVHAATQSAQTTNRAYTLQHRTIWPNGEIHWLLSHGMTVKRHGQAASLYGLAINIDALKETEQRLQESERRFREMADTTPVLIWMVDARRQAFYFNKAWLAFTGRTPVQESGVGWTEGIHAEDFAACMARYSQAFDEQESFSMEFRLRRHDGSHRWVTANGAPRFAGDNKTFLGYVGTCFDIDDVKHGQELERMNLLLKKQRAQLMSLNNAKDEFISIASHQLRTPASAVKQYVGLLLEGYVGELTDMQLKMVKAAYESNQRQLGIIEALLRVAQVDAGKITPVKRTCDIVQLLEDVIQEQQVKFRRRKQVLTYEHPDTPLIASVDQRLLRMVLENLIDNASKYSQDGKNITVTVNRKRTAIVLHIADEGVGISTKDQTKLFQKFSRLSNPLTSLVSGSGLGLYWAKKIVDLHGGTIDVASKESVGSTFTITLPFQ